MKSAFRSTLEFLIIVLVAAGALSLFNPETGVWRNWVSFNEEPPILSASLPTKAASEHILIDKNLIDKNQGIEPGFTLIPQSGTDKVLLINSNKQVVHSWNLDAQRARLLPNGNLLVIHGSKIGMQREPWKSLGSVIREYTWDGKVAWEFHAPDKVHHDIHRLPNGNTLFLVRSEVPENVRIKMQDPVRRKANIKSDGILEVNSEGKIVWDWYFHDHFDPNQCGQVRCSNLPEKFAKGLKPVDWTHTNTASPIPDNKWYDAGDKRFKPGNVLVMARNWSTAFLIDRETKKVVWRYTGSYKGGLGGGHEVHMIPKGLPGAGNILIFDNGREHHSGMSFILEVNPQTKGLEWVYDVGHDFFSEAAGSIQRLPNGNTLISEDLTGRVFEVSKTGETLWSYKSPVRTCRGFRYPTHYSRKFDSL